MRERSERNFYEAVRVFECLPPSEIFQSGAQISTWLIFSVLDTDWKFLHVSCFNASSNIVQVRTNGWL